MSITRPTYDEFVTHARRFGVECVFETATTYLARRELALLRSELDELSSSSKRSRRPTASKHRRTDFDLIEQVIALRDEGLVPAAIADKLNLGERRVRSILATSQTSQSTTQKWLNQAGDDASYAVGRPVGHPPASEPVDALTA
jgi:hypothetical protein